VVKKAQFTDPRVTDYLTSVLVMRRDKIARVWLNAVNPLADFALAPDGTLTFRNVAVEAHAATPGSGYAISWSRFDNATDAHTPAGSTQTVSQPQARAPADVLTGASARSRFEIPPRTPGVGAARPRLLSTGGRCLEDGWTGAPSVALAWHGRLLEWAPRAKSPEGHALVRGRPPVIESCRG
jgi:hypothetical protein